MKGCICHIVKWQIHPCIFKGTICCIFIKHVLKTPTTGFKYLLYFLFIVCWCKVTITYLNSSISIRFFEAIRRNDLYITHTYLPKYMPNNITCVLHYGWRYLRGAHILLVPHSWLILKIYKIWTQLNTYSAEILLYKPWQPKVFFYLKSF